MSDLLATYRAVIASLNTVTAPSALIRGELYVRRPESAGDELASALLLEPTSSHLLIGGIGSGKTTELFMAKRHINQTSNIRVIYLDVAERVDLKMLEPGVLLLLAGVALSKQLNPEQASKLVAEVNRLRIAAFGSWQEVESEEPPDEKFFVPGKLSSLAPTTHLVQRLADDLRAVVEEFGRNDCHAVIFFDGLDRIHDPRVFESVIREDVVALHGIGVGTVVVAPLRTLYGAERTVVQRLDDYSFLWDIDVEQSAVGREFLMAVLRARVPKTIVSDEVCAALITASGGVLRDLIALSKAAAQRAYFKESPVVTIEYVDAAAALAGQKLLFRVNKSSQKKKLLALAERGRHGFHQVLSDNDDLELLDTRHILQYRKVDGQPRYVVHPLLVPLLTEGKPPWGLT